MCGSFNICVTSCDYDMPWRGLSLLSRFYLTCFTHVCWNWCSKWNFCLMSEALLAWPKYGVEKSPYLALLSWSWNCHWTTVARCRPPSIRKWLKSQGENPCDDPIIPCEDGSDYGYQQHASWDTHLLVWGIGLYKYPLMYILIYILYGLLLMNHPVLLTKTHLFKQIPTCWCTHCYTVKQQCLWIVYLFLYVNTN